MKILFVGDVVGPAGVNCARVCLPRLKRRLGVDFTVVNCENASATSGVLPAAARELLDAGADLLTGGNHSFGKKQMLDELEENPRILRPANYPSGAPGRGRFDLDCGAYSLTVINLIGRVFLDPLESPFVVLERELSRDPGRIVLVDFHAEATSEKRALAYFADGRITALCGTHTHVQTADARVLPGGTGFLTDAGMTGVIDSNLGADDSVVLNRFLTGLRAPLALAEGKAALCGALIDADEKTGRCRSITAVREEE